MRQCPAPVKGGYLRPRRRLLEMTLPPNGAISATTLDDDPPPTHRHAPRRHHLNRCPCLQGHRALQYAALPSTSTRTGQERHRGVLHELTTFDFTCHADLTALSANHQTRSWSLGAQGPCRATRVPRYSPSCSANSKNFRKALPKAKLDAPRPGAALALNYILFRGQPAAQPRPRRAEMAGDATDAADAARRDGLRFGTSSSPPRAKSARPTAPFSKPARTAASASSAWWA